MPIQSRRAIGARVAHPPGHREEERQRQRHAQEQQRGRADRMRRVAQLDEHRPERERDRAGEGEGDAPATAGRLAVLNAACRGSSRARRARSRGRPCEPIVRAALFAIASREALRCLPPRGPVLPNRTSFDHAGFGRRCRLSADAGFASARCLRRGAALQLLVGRLAVDRLLVGAGDERARDQRLALPRRDRADLAARRQDEGALGDARAALLVEQATPAPRPRRAR